MCVNLVDCWIIGLTQDRADQLTLRISYEMYFWFNAQIHICSENDAQQVKCPSHCSAFNDQRPDNSTMLWATSIMALD